MTDHTSMDTQMRASNVSDSLFDMEENFLNGNLEENCEKIEEYIGGLPRFAEGDGLERTRKLLKLLSVWECEIPRIHVAGTNGKGSTCAYLQSLFMGHGYKVGGFISPHLVTMRHSKRFTGRQQNLKMRKRSIRHFWNFFLRWAWLFSIWRR